MLKYFGKCLIVESGKKKILVVGDLHLGYEEFLNRSGIFVSRIMFDEMIQYFDRFFAEIGNVNEIVLLGDVKHEFGSIIKQEKDDSAKLFDYLGKKCEKIIVIKGNHDKILEPLVRNRKKILLRDYFIEGKFCFLHGDKNFNENSKNSRALASYKASSLEIFDKKVEFIIMGHWHPAVRLSEGAKSEKYKCFLEAKLGRKNIIILPSFSEYSEGTDPRDTSIGKIWGLDVEKFKVKIVADNFKVLDFGILKKFN